MLTEVFRSLDPENIHTADNTPWGVRALQGIPDLCPHRYPATIDDGLSQATNDPAKPGTYLLGIECDGASYHSGRSARDRDRLRQEILEKLGWKIHRIWSTDWFKGRGGEIKRLVSRIEDLVQSDPAYQEMRQKAARRDSLRHRLIELRDREITLAFPDTPEDKCLFRDGILEELIQKRPKTRNEWFRKIPEQVRCSIDSKQVGRYLDRVFEIIVECG